MKNVAIYYRVSTEEQELRSQQKAVEDWLLLLPPDKQPSSIQVFKDEGRSGYQTSKRAGYLEMMRLAHDKKIDTIIVYRLDRFSRNAGEAIKTILDLAAGGVEFVSISQPILNLRADNPFRFAMLAIFAEIAEMERATIIARVTAGLNAAKARGVRLGAPCKIDETKIAHAKELKASGLSYKQVAKQVGLSVGSVYKMVNGSEDSLKTSK